MKKVLFGIALILFAMLIHFVDPWLPIIYEDKDWLVLLMGFVGLVIAGIGAFTKDQ